ncbi:hypothetical protein AH156_19805 [Salmonella enterica subsp. enterica serovar Enteritidis]|nr:hypothetical protein [Salmonella enterica subsp. enterica serovar Enteritidis]
MNTQIQTLNQANLAHPSNVNAGAVTIEAQRAITEAQTKIQIAKMFPRNEAAAFDKLMFACSQIGFAEDAFYSLPRGDKSISGPSIRLAEEIARVYGNFTYGHRELSRGQGKSEVEVFAWDVENNNYTSRQLTVMHIQDTKSGSYALKSQADVDTRISNIASKQLRGRILSLIPKWMLSAAIERCRATLAGGDDITARNERIAMLEKRFATRNVSKANLEQYLGVPLNMITDEQIADLFGVYTALKEGASTAEFFIQDAPQQNPTAAKLEQAVAGNSAPQQPEKPARAARQPRKPKEQPQPAQQPEPEQPQQPEQAQDQQTQDIAAEVAAAAKLAQDALAGNLPEQQPDANQQQVPEQFNETHPPFNPEDYQDMNQGKGDAF